MRNLWPPIEVIASNLKTNNGSISFLQEQLVSESESTDNDDVVLPEFIREKVRRRVAAREASFGTQPQTGQIWRFDGKQTDLSPLCVLLNRCLDENRWEGWIVSPETDYASNKDVLLEPIDEPFDPVAAMVQTWNQVTVDIREGGRVLAELAESRIDAIREVASGQCEEGGAARAGFVAPLKTGSGAGVLSGTRIIHYEDPRQRYQSLYREAAQRFEKYHSDKNIIPISKYRMIGGNVGWAIAASVILAQAVVIATMTGTQSNDAQKYEEFRASPLVVSDFGYLEVYFKPDSKEVDIRKLLTILHVAIIDGPGEFGQYKLKVKLVDEQEVIRRIEGSGLVDSVVKVTSESAVR